MPASSLVDSAASRLLSVAAHYGLRAQGDSLRLPCPAHQGQDPNLHLWVDEPKARLGAYCHSHGCSYAAVAAAVESACGVRIGPNAPRTLVTDYGGGRVVTRIDRPGRPKQVINRRGSRFPGAPVKLFRPERPASSPSLAVLCEGEMVAQSIASSGFVAAAWIGGAGREALADFSPLASFSSVALWPDDDPPGQAAMRQAAVLLSGLPGGGPALYFVAPQDYDGSSKRDAADYPPEMRVQLIREAAPFVPSAGETASAQENPPEGQSPAGFSERSAMADAWRILDRFGPSILLAAPSDPAGRHLVHVLNPDTGIWRGGPEPLERINSDTAKAFALESVNLLLQGGISAAEAQARQVWARRVQNSQGAAEAGRMLWSAAGQMEQAGQKLKFSLCSEAELDPAGRYLGFANGVVDLDSGRLLPPGEGAAHWVTRPAPHVYDPGAEHQDVARLLEHLDPELRDFLLDSAGYALRGQPNRRIVLLAGQPNSGKSTFLRALHTALAPTLCFALPAAALLRERASYKNQHTAGMTPLLTARIATASELPRNDSLVDEGVLKSISGGDAQSLREPNQRTRLNRPASATVFLALNTVESGCDDLSRIPTRDEALRDRLQIIDLPSIPGLRDPAVLERLGSPAAGQAMLAMLVRRAIANPEPPRPPRAVRLAVQRQYSGYVGPVGSWAVSNLEFTHSREDFVTPGQLWEALCLHLSAAGAPLPSSRKEGLEQIRLHVSLPRQERRRVGGEVASVYFGVRIREPGPDG